MARKKRSKKEKQRRRLWRFLVLQILLIILVTAAITYYYTAGYAGKVSDMREEAISFVENSTPETFRQDESSIVYDVNGNVISQLKGEKESSYLTYDEIPIYAIEAFISIEDKRFYQHNGVDYKAIARAVYAMYKNGEVTQGASTITQQLARNVFLTQDKTWERKVEEIYLASELEKKYSKNQILEFYINDIYFGNGYYGIGAAAKGYFNKNVNQLNLSEIAFLVAIPNNPTYYDPIKNYDHTMTRHDKILKNMLEDKVISEKTYNAAMDCTITLESPETYEKQDYAETYIYYCATRALMQLDGFTFKNEFESDEERTAYESEYDSVYNACNKKLFTNGYRIYTTIDLDMQQHLQDAIDIHLYKYNEVGDDGIYALQGAGVCIDNTTGMVKAIVGGRSQEIEGYTLNRAFQSFRQPGSSIKPIIVYTPAIERLGYTADSIVVDERLENGPSNSDGKYLGAITLRKAVEQSRNTVAYKLMFELQPKVALQYLIKMDFSKLDSRDNQLAISLGGFTYGVSPLEMARAYATLANDGACRDSTCIQKITDSDGNVLYENDTEETVIYSVNAARQMTDILEGVLTNGTAKGMSLDNDMPAAGKTGTTNENKDGWFCGYTRYYTTTIWVGYDTPREMKGLYGSTYPARIWQTFMNQIHEGLEPLAFLDPIVDDTAEGANADGAEENAEGINADGTEEGVNAEGENTQNADGQTLDENGNPITNTGDATDQNTGDAAGQNTNGATQNTDTANGQSADASQTGTAGQNNAAQTNQAVTNPFAQ